MMDKVEDCISFIVGKASQTITRRARELLSPFQITPVQYAVLKAMLDTEPTNAADLIHRLAIDTSTITGVLDRLEANSWLVRSIDKKDRRIQRLQLTPKARKQISKMDEAMEILNQEIRDNVGKDANAVWRGLSKLGLVKRN